MKMLKISEIQDCTSWECVHFINKKQLDISIDELNSLGIYTASISGALINNENELFKSLAEAFSFPDYFGNNWDALSDCLGDLTWLPASKGFVLIFESSDLMLSDCSFITGKLISLWLSVAELWSGDEIPFHLIFSFDHDV